MGDSGDKVAFSPHKSLLFFRIYHLNALFEKCGKESACIAIRLEAAILKQCVIDSVIDFFRTASLAYATKRPGTVRYEELPKTSE